MGEQPRFGELVITGVLLAQSQTCLWREERGENLILVAAKDETSGETGHILYCVQTDKRDIEEEETWTDNPLLFANEHPEASALQDLLGLATKDTPRERTEALDDILGACWAGSQVTVGNDDDDPDGLYAE